MFFFLLIVSNNKTYSLDTVSERAGKIFIFGRGSWPGADLYSSRTEEYADCSKFFFVTYLKCLASKIIRKLPKNRRNVSPCLSRIKIPESGCDPDYFLLLPHFFLSLN